ncbi:hypothetical protein HOY80DRAFT_198399 [Tuber brumale]|nr:hypothetical protein HOY80DRAFT_198399 [Tuber brumale]
MGEQYLRSTTFSLLTAPFFLLVWGNEIWERGRDTRDKWKSSRNLSIRMRNMIEAVGFFFLLSPLFSCLTLVMIWGVLGKRIIASKWIFEIDWTEWRIGGVFFFFLVKFGIVFLHGLLIEVVESFSSISFSNPCGWGWIALN